MFLTALFYLLSYSEQNYLPVKWVMDFLPHLTPSPQSDAGDRGGAGGSETSEDYGKVFSRAIRCAQIWYWKYTLHVCILPTVTVYIWDKPHLVEEYVSL